MGSQGSCQQGRSKPTDRSRMAVRDTDVPRLTLQAEVALSQVEGHKGWPHQPGRSEVISVDPETGTLGRSNQIDQQALKVGHFQTGWQRSYSLLVSVDYWNTLQGCRVWLLFLGSQNCHIQAYEKGGQYESFYFMKTKKKSGV